MAQNTQVFESLYIIGTKHTSVRKCIHYWHKTHKCSKVYTLLAQNTQVFESVYIIGTKHTSVRKCLKLELLAVFESKQTTEIYYWLHVTHCNMTRRRFTAGEALENIWEGSPRDGSDSDGDPSSEDTPGSDWGNVKDIMKL